MRDVGIVGLGVLSPVIMPAAFGVLPILRNVVIGPTVSTSHWWSRRGDGDEPPQHANATDSVVAATAGILIPAIILGTVPNLIARLTTPRGFRVSPRPRSSDHDRRRRGQQWHPDPVGRG